MSKSISCVYIGPVVNYSVFFFFFTSRVLE